MGDVFNAYSSYYNLIYKDKDYFSEAKYVIELMKRYYHNPVNIIEFGSGTGKHANIFHENGFQVLGVEPSTEMLKISSENKKEGLSFVNASINSFRDDKEYDIALALFHVISYLNTNVQLLDAFQNINKHLKTGGIFIFDVWYTPAVLTQVPSERIKVIEDENVKVVRHATPVNHWNKNIIDVIYSVEVSEKLTGASSHFSETHSMRHYGIPEVELLAISTGFELLKTEEFMSSKEAGSDTWGVCFVLKKL